MEINSATLTSNFIKSNSVYDIMVYSYISLGKYSSNKIKGYNPNNYRNLFELISLYNESEQTSEDLFKLKSNLCDWISSRNIITYVDIIAIIIGIDINFEFKVKIISLDNSDYEIIESLSNVENSNIIVLPRNPNNLTSHFNSNLQKFEQSQKGYRKDKSGLRNRRDGIIGINTKLSNYDIFDASNYKPILYTSRYSNDICNKLIAKGNVNVAFFPLTSINSEKIFNITFSDEASFSVDNLYPDCEEVIFKRYCTAIQVCKQNEVDFAVFPEMLLSHSIIEKIHEMIMNSNPNDLPELIVLGTLWENDSNKCIVISKNGDILFEQHKQTEFLYMGKFVENLSLDNNKLHIIDILGVGRFFTYICIDIKNPNLKLFAETFFPDIIFLPSYTPSRDLINSSKYLASERWCTTLMCNSCSAICPSKSEHITDDIRKSIESNIGFICAPAKKNTERDVYTHEIFLTDECSNCSSDCLGRIITIEFSTCKQYNGDIIAQSMYTLTPKI